MRDYQSFTKMAYRYAESAGFYENDFPIGTADIRYRIICHNLMSGTSAFSDADSFSGAVDELYTLVEDAHHWLCKARWCMPTVDNEKWESWSVAPQDGHCDTLYCIKYTWYDIEQDRVYAAIHAEVTYMM